MDHCEMAIIEMVPITCSCLGLRDLDRGEEENKITVLVFWPPFFNVRNDSGMINKIWLETLLFTVYQ